MFDSTHEITIEQKVQELKQSNVMTMPKNLVFERTSNLAFLKNQLLALSMKPKNPQNTLRT